MSGALRHRGYFVPSAAVTGVLSGTTVPTITETDVVNGGKTTIITLTGDTWVAAGATFNAQRQAIIDGFDAASSPTNGWNNEVRDNEVVTAVVRTSDTVVTITWTAAASYDISATETITNIIPNAALVTSTGDITSTPTFTVTAVVSGSIINSSARFGGIAGHGGIAGKGGGLVG